MSSIARKIQKNTENFMVKEYYKNMTPEMYQQGINNAIKLTEERLTKEYNAELLRIAKEFDRKLQEGTLLAMDTLATEMVYELGNILECYKDEPEYLDQKIDIVQGIYKTAMQSIEDYAGDKYETDKQAQKEFERKKKTIQKIFGMGENNGKKKSK
jgi:uncharacterized protein (DUF2164 family)